MRPKDAASLIVYKFRRNRIAVLMGRRRARATFAPGMYVFPGGRPDGEDFRIQPAAGFDHRLVTDRAAFKSPRHACGLALAAVRETFEETGLLLAETGNIHRVRHPSWRAFRQRGLAPAIDRLHYIGRAITPTVNQQRFHARFFAIPADYLTGRLGGDGELLDLRWVPVGNPDGLPMFDVTEFMLAEFVRADSGRRGGTPVLSYRRGTALIRYQ